MKILISPYPARLFDGRTSPKAYPHWTKLVQLLNKEGYEVVQIGVSGEDRIDDVAQFVTNFPFRKLRDMVNECALWIATDNFFPHFVHCERLKPGIVLWGPSDPRIFGYPENINLLRGRDFLRPNQYQSWTEWQWNPQSFVFAENVIPSVVKLSPPPIVKPQARAVYSGIY